MSSLAQSPPARRLARSLLYEPVGLGARQHDWRIVLDTIDRQPQSVIRSRLADSASTIAGHDRESLALKVATLVLRDYCAGGMYPVITAGRCHLVPLADLLDLDEHQRRRLLQAQFVASRDAALLERDDGPWLARAAEALRHLDGRSPKIAQALAGGQPVDLVRAEASRRAGDARGRWRAVRATWSMLPEASAPGRELAYVAEYDSVPVGILQIRNVVPEIRARDEWLGVCAHPDADGQPVGIAARLTADPSVARERLQTTAGVLEAMLGCVQTDGLPKAPAEAAPEELAAWARVAREQAHASRRAGDTEPSDRALRVAKRAETAAELSAGARALRQAAADDPLGALRSSSPLQRAADRGLRKLWHYHMGVVALELSICGAAPPFGPLRVGKLMAALAASAPVLDDWGHEHDLGLIARHTFDPDVRSAVPSPGPLVVLTSGLYPGHAAQYERVEVNGRRWRRIGHTTGWGNFHIAHSTMDAMIALNDAADGYRHITRRFGEGANARFRSAGKALEHAGLPDLRQHEIRRPLYALALVEDPGAVLLGWSNARADPPPSVEAVCRAWFTRWVQPRPDLMPRVDGPDLPATVADLATRATTR